MTPFQVFVVFSTIRLHFSTKTYDYFKYRGQSRSVTPESFARTPSQYPFSVISRKFPSQDDVEHFFVSQYVCPQNLLKEPYKIWITDMNMDNYLWWKKRRDAQLYTFTEEVSLLDERYQIGNVFKLSSNEDRVFPQVLENIINGEIGLDFINLSSKALSDESFYIWNHFDKKISEDLIYPILKLKSKKIDQFLPISEPDLYLTVLSKGYKRNIKTPIN